MLSHVVSSTEIAEAQAALEATMAREFPETETRTIIYPGGRVLGAQVMTDGRYWYFPQDFTDDPDAGTPRTFNWFGIMQPGHLRITVEVNVVPEGRNSKIEGFFARDHTTGALYLMHTGRVAGGAPGVGGRAFRAWNGEPRVEVYDASGNVRFGFAVMQVNATLPLAPSFAISTESTPSAKRFGAARSVWMTLTSNARCRSLTTSTASLAGGAPGTGPDKLTISRVMATSSMHCATGARGGGCRDVTASSRTSSSTWAWRTHASGWSNSSR